MRKVEGYCEEGSEEGRRSPKKGRGSTEEGRGVV